MRTIDASSDRARVLRRLRHRPQRHRHARPNSAPTWCSAAANPNGTGVHYDRDFQAATGPQETFSKGISFFVQDEVQFGKLTLNLGVRTERWEHFATTGENIYTFQWEFAPRLSAAYDILGDGKHKASAFWGRYYDPVRNNMTNFAGTLTGSILEEQVFVPALNKYVTYRTRGGPAVQDAFFSPTTQTPYTDDLQFGYAVDLGNNMSFDALYYNRRTPRHPRGLRPRALRGSERLPRPDQRSELAVPRLRLLRLHREPGLELRHRHAGRRQARLQRPRVRVPQALRRTAGSCWRRTTGTTPRATPTPTRTPTSRATWIYLDPRAPNQFGTQPGLIRHLAKGAGVVHVRLRPAARRHVLVELGHGRQPHVPGVGPQPAAPRPAGGGVRIRRLHQPLAGAGLGRLAREPVWGKVDLRAQYNRASSDDVDVEFFVDLFNIANNQSRSATRISSPAPAATPSAARSCGSNRAARSSARA